MRAALQSSLAGDPQGPRSLRKVLQDHPVLGAFACGQLVTKLAQLGGDGRGAEIWDTDAIPRILEVLVACAVLCRQTMATLASTLFECATLRATAARTGWRLRLLLAAGLLVRAEDSTGEILCFISQLIASCLEDIQGAVVCGLEAPSSSATGDSEATVLSEWTPDMLRSKMHAAASLLTARADDCDLPPHALAVLRAFTQLTAPDITPQTRGALRCSSSGDVHSTPTMRHQLPPQAAQAFGRRGGAELETELGARLSDLLVSGGMGARGDAARSQLRTSGRRCTSLSEVLSDAASRVAAAGPESPLPLGAESGGLSPHARRSGAAAAETGTNGSPAGWQGTHAGAAAGGAGALWAVAEERGWGVGEVGCEFAKAVDATLRAGLHSYLT